MFNMALKINTLSDYLFFGTWPSARSFLASHTSFFFIGASKSSSLAFAYSLDIGSLVTTCSLDIGLLLTCSLGWLRYRKIEVSNNSEISHNWEIWDWMDLNSCLLKTFCPQLRVISSSSSFFRLGLAELVDNSCIRIVTQFLRPQFWRQKVELVRKANIALKNIVCGERSYQLIIQWLFYLNNEV